MIRVRKEHPAFGHSRFEWVDCGNEAIAAYKRWYEEENLLIIHNLSSASQQISITLPEASDKVTELLSGTVYGLQDQRLGIELSPRQFLWLDIMGSLLTRR
jgi:maltose alpha-D-glucosyltransferase/alpha-amylase